MYVGQASFCLSFFVARKCRPLVSPLEKSDPFLETLFTVLLAQSIIRCLHLFLNWTAGSSRFVVDLSMHKPPGIAWAVPEMKTTLGVSFKVRSDQF